MNKIFYIIYWYKHEKEGHLHRNNNGEPVIFDNREAAFSYIEELIIKNPDYEFALRSTRSDKEVNDVL